jgi:hypothetical protein
MFAYDRYVERERKNTRMIRQVHRNTWTGRGTVLIADDGGGGPSIPGDLNAAIENSYGLMAGSGEEISRGGIK